MSNSKTNEITIKADSGAIPFRFEDKDGTVYASCRVNPADPRLLERFEEATSYFEGLSERQPEISTAKDIAELDKQLADKMCELLGYDVRDELFGRVSPLTMLPDGNVFISLVLDSIADNIKPAIEARRENAKKLAKKYTARFENE